MAQLAALCMDEASCANPALVGLAGENLSAQGWLKVCSAGLEARDAIKSNQAIKHVWVLSCDDVEPINLAASLKQDRADLFVELVDAEACGSLMSRAHNAHIDRVVGTTFFVREYGELKGRHAIAQEKAKADVVAGGDAVQDCKDRAGTVPRSACEAARVAGSYAFPLGQNLPASKKLSDIPTVYNASSGRSSADSENTQTTANSAAAPAFHKVNMPLSEPSLGSSIKENDQQGACVAVSGPGSISPRSDNQGIQNESPSMLRQVSAENAVQNTQNVLVRKAETAVKSAAFVMPVVSGSGGAGKSAVSVVAARIAHNMGFKTLLLDYDLQFGDAASLSGVSDPISIDRAFNHPDLLDRAIEQGNGFVVVAPPSRLEASELIVRVFPSSFDELAGRFDVVIANTGAAWAEQHAALLERSNAALFLVDQRASSVRACQHALELCARCGIATGPFRFVLNRCSKNAPLTSIDVACALRGASVFELKDGGRDVEDFLTIGDPAGLIDSRNEFSTSLAQLLVRTLPEPRGGRTALSDSSRRKPESQEPEKSRKARKGGRLWGKGRS